jgi:hypothetical protein
MATIPLSTLGPRIGRISPDGVENSERLAADAATQPSRTVVVTESVNRSRTCTSFVARPLAAAILLGLASGQALGQDADKVAIFMRAKLEHVEQVLEVLTLKDYDKIGKQAREMSLLSQAATWQVLQTAEYRDRSMVFDAAWMPSPKRREKKI